MQTTLYRESLPVSSSVRALACPLADPLTNQLLAALTPSEWARWLPWIEPVDMPLGQVLCESGHTQQHVYFPSTAIVSLLHVMENGACAETAAIGHEGVVGVPLFMGGDSMPSRAVVQNAGTGFRLKARVIKEEFNRLGPAMHLLLRYTQTLITQITQLGACNRHHSLDMRLCHWLLRRLDRLRSTEMFATQELIANMLGVRREGVTESASKLQKAGLIPYTRGHISVLDRTRLEQQTCECYAVVSNEQRRLLPPRALSRLAALNGQPTRCSQ